MVDVRRHEDGIDDELTNRNASVFQQDNSSNAIAYRLSTGTDVFLFAFFRALDLEKRKLFSLGILDDQNDLNMRASLFKDTM